MVSEKWLWRYKVTDERHTQNERIVECNNLREGEGFSCEKGLLLSL